ncbi:hypothetical protein VIGAN_04103200 [Vigna angularis var. angularis]|uniref:Uncharacterized protein n=1 Tax=Vigna angularis var. angularis TaxID=157739 RepID=A0A0S3RTA3_PHAAN|nr:hypothetical protein VIGAN_04103200 [Vigna angularis var. angularis]
MHRAAKRNTVHISAPNSREYTFLSNHHIHCFNHHRMCYSPNSSLNAIKKISSSFHSTKVLSAAVTTPPHEKRSSLLLCISRLIPAPLRFDLDGRNRAHPFTLL